MGNKNSASKKCFKKVDIRRTLKSTGKKIRNPSEKIKA